MQNFNISAIFHNTQNSYKYYWWLCIIEIYNENKELEISFNDIILKIISKVWYSVNYFKLSFGKQDQCSKLVKEIQKVYQLEDNISEVDLYTFLRKHKNSDFLVKITNELTKYVPYRFIRPWYSVETRGLKDSLVNSRILELQDNRAPYRLEDSSKKVLIDSEWGQWITDNYILIKHFSLFKLLEYLESENPNVFNISKKLERPIVRQLTSQIKHWKNFIIEEPHRVDIFENIPLSDLNQFSIDHFLPWSFLSHDLIWNLHPISKNVNSSKGNFLPHKKHLSQFYNLQFVFCNYLLQTKKNKALEDYYTLFNCSNEELRNLSKEAFYKEMGKYYLPQFEVAKNMGFKSDWIYT